MARDLDFANIDHPDKVAAFLRACADSANEGAGECEAAWQDKTAGRPWVIVARELERAAARLEKLI